MSAVLIAISTLPFIAACAAGPLPAQADKVQTADQAIERAKWYCGRHNRNDEWTAKFHSGVWIVHEKKPVDPTIDAYLIEYIRASDGAGGRCEGLSLPDKISD
jgi:hypothetical protein